MAMLPNDGQSTALATQSEAIVISRYQVLVDDVAQAEKDNTEAKFNYRDRQGNKDARSHCYKLRALKGKIDAARKEEKADIVKLGKAIDDQARGLTQRVQALIDPHQDGIDRIAREEAERQRRHEDLIDRIRALGRVPFNTPSAIILERLSMAKGADVSSLEEYIKDGKAAQADTILELERALSIAETAEKAAAELERLREEDRLRKEAEAEAERKRKADELTAKIRQEAQAEAEAVAVEQIEEAEQRAAAAEVRADAAEASSRASDPQPLPKLSIEPPVVANVAKAARGAASLPSLGKSAVSLGNLFVGANPTRTKLVEEICQAMQGLSRLEVAEALADNRLHGAINVCY